MTTAFVLSGGGNYGALQVGALEVLLEQGLRPDLLVGVSAGALNAAWLAPDPSPRRVRELAAVWTESAPAFFPPPNRLTMLVRLMQGRDSLLPNDGLLDFIRSWTDAEARFGDFQQPRLYVLAARLDDGSPRLFGDDPDDRLLDGLMASTALPPLFPPWRVDGVAYIDGGAYSDLPLQMAVARGADEIYALQICHLPAFAGGLFPEGLLAVSGQAVGVLVNRNTELEIEAVRRTRGVRLHLIELWPSHDPGFWDFSHAESLIADGRRAAEAYLAARARPRPLAWLSDRVRRLVAAGGRECPAPAEEKPRTVD